MRRTGWIEGGDAGVPGGFVVDVHRLRRLCRLFGQPKRYAFGKSSVEICAISMIYIE